MTAQFDPADPTRFEEMYRDDRVAHGLPAATPWDIGVPSRWFNSWLRWARSEVRCSTRAPGGHHAIYYAAKGYAATGIDGSVAAIERARDNARKAGCR